MGRAPCCDKANVKKGPWSPEEDSKLKNYIDKYGTGGNWIALPQKAGLRRCGKSCRLRWLNYLRPNLKHGEFTEDEDRIICTLFANIGTRWSIIAAQLPGRTDNDIKNYWNTKLKKKLLGPLMVPPTTHHQITKLHKQSHTHSCSSSLLHHQTLTPPSLNFNTNPTTCPSSHHLFQTQQGQETSLVDPTRQYHVEENNNNLLVFGSQDQTSCSSSDNGSYYSQTSRDRIINIKQEHHHQNHQVGFVQSFVSNTGFHERSSLGYNGMNNDHDQQWTATPTTTDDHKEKGYFGEFTFDDDIAMFEQLISSNNYSYGDIDDYEKKQVMDML